jgi:hypothetical protein
MRVALRQTLLMGVSMKNRIKLRSLLLVIVIYLALLVYAVGMADELGPGLPVLILLYVGACIVLARTFYRTARERQAAGTGQFKKVYPLTPYGIQLAGFRYVFHSSEDLLGELRERIKSAVAERTGFPALSEVRFEDVDKQLAAPDQRVFWKSSGPANRRENSVSLVLHLNRVKAMQAIHWWVFGLGYIDRDKLFRFTAFAPLSLPFWIVKYLRHEYDPVSQVRTIHGGFYNDLDMVTEVKALHETVFDTLVAVLEAHGIDVSDLRAQRAQVMNIQISGGRTQIGQIIQGAVNRVAPQAQRAA